MKFLVISRTHSLLPVAYRLKLEGQDVEALVDVPGFEKAWDGKLRKVLRGSKGQISPETLEPVIRSCERGDVTLLTDSWNLESVFGNAQRKLGVLRPSEGEQLPTKGLRVGFWFDGAEALCFHLLVVDRGAWGGGMGPEVDGGLTLCRIENQSTLAAVQEFVKPTLNDLVAKGFVGLVEVGINLNTRTGQPEVEGTAAGWPFLHTHAFLSGVEGFHEIVSGSLGENGEPRHPFLPRRYTTVIPVSRPPWPNRKARFRRPVQIQGLTPQQVGRVFWHDLKVDDSDQTLWTAGLDGLVGVARGEADTSELSRGRAVEIAHRMQMPEKQYRPDVGLSVQPALAELEMYLGLTL